MRVHRTIKYIVPRLRVFAIAPDYRNGGNRITDVDDRASGGRPTWDGNEASNSNNWATIEGAWDPLHEANEGNWLSVRAAYERSAARQPRHLGHISCSWQMQNPSVAS